MTKTLLFNKGLVTMDNQRRQYQSGAVLIENDRIAEVGRSHELLERADPDTERIDLRGRWVLPGLINTFNLKQPVRAKDLVIPGPEGVETIHVHCMRTLPWVPITEGYEADLPVRDGFIRADTSQDTVHIAVVERHHATGNIGKAFIGGFGLQRGAAASSVAHDNHNIVVMGVDPEDMAVAANRVAELKGGIVLVEDRQVVGEIPLPIAGLLTDLDAYALSEKRQALLEKAAEMGFTVPEPFMFLSFITLAAIPSFCRHRQRLY